MATINLYLPDDLRRRMDDASGEDWSAIAQQAFESHLERLAVSADASRDVSTRVYGPQASHASEEKVAANAAYDHGYAWAKGRAVHRELQAVVDSPDYRSAADVVRRTKGFSASDEFGNCAFPSDEMWEAFVDGATALYNDMSD